jgi:hypothetical protein
MMSERLCYVDDVGMGKERKEEGEGGKGIHTDRTD